MRERDAKIWEVESAYSAKLRDCDFPRSNTDGISSNRVGVAASSGLSTRAGGGAAGKLLPADKLARLEQDYAREIELLEQEHDRRKAYIDSKYSMREERLDSLRIATLSGDDDKVRDLAKMVSGKSQMYTRSIDPNSIIKAERSSISSDKDHDYQELERAISQARQGLDRAYQSLRQQVATGGGANALMPQYTDLNVRQYINFGGSDSTSSGSSSGSNSSSFSNPFSNSSFSQFSNVRDYKSQNAGSSTSSSDLRARAGKLEDLAPYKKGPKINKTPR